MTISKKSPAGEPRAEGGWFGRLSTRLGATREKLSRQVGDLLLGKRELDPDLIETLETLLLGADLGVDTTEFITRGLAERIARKELDDTYAVYAALRAMLLEILAPCAQPLDVGSARPFVVMAVGVNGSGKTTSVGKLGLRFKNEGRRVMLAAADTFRAAAVEQLQSWGARHAIPVVSGAGADAAAVAHDAMYAAQGRGVDVLLIDTAGRLHTQSGLMDELKKIKRVLTKVDARAPHETLLVLDANNGQNALAQYQHFDAAVGVTGLCLTKLDGTAKGGVLFALARRARKPVRYIGVGEDADDLREFDAREFVDALLPA